ncbi:ATP-binding protein [Chitinilyticum piscinae]|uniref:histidine kinase n=1 Tax=Chitinilyticum piscinae TaxID=2866724 RepID=A0A8J7FJA8_9NEIS|nr:ATP-binding protein [Chitinilyticum piscinae]MBE9608547.1 GAF domain-containing protein [Chitinilyticum piscinae]
MSDNAPLPSLRDQIDQISELAHQQRGLAYEHCLAALEQARGSGDDAAFIALTVLYARLIDQRGYPDSDIDLLHEGLQLAQERLQLHEQAALLHVIGRAYYTRAEYRNALQSWILARECAIQCGDRLSWAHIDAGIAQIYDGLGDHATACTLHEEASRRAADLADPELQLNMQLNLGYSQYRLGRLGEARSNYQQALLLSRQLEHRDDEGEALFRLAEVDLQEGLLDAARQGLADAQRLCHSAAHWWGLANVHINQARMAKHCGDSSAARRHAEEGLASALRAGARHVELACHRLIAELAEADGQYAQALASERQATQLEQAISHHSGNPWDLRALEDLAGIRISPERRLLQLAAEPMLFQGEMTDIAQLLCRRAREIVPCNAVSLWLNDPHREQMSCQLRSPPARFRLPDWDIRSSAELNTLLASGSALVAHTAAHHLALQPVYAEHLAPLGIKSLLIIPLQQNGARLGMLLFEHVQRQHNWLLEEVQYANQVGIITLRALGILEQRRLQAALNQKTRELEEARDHAEAANQAKTQFISRVSHELRTPMHAILSFARLGQDKLAFASQEQLNRYFSNIVESGQRMLEQVNDLLDITKVSAGKMSFSFSRHDLAQLCEVVCSEITALARNRQISIDLLNRCSDSLLDCDGGRIEQIIRNLLSNAIKFSQKNGAIQVQLQDSDVTLTLSVIDHGTGIPEADLPKIFEPFYQSDQHHYGGTGLGLAICREIAAAHSGSLLAHNLAGGGACFTLTLPRHQPGTQTVSTASAAR